MNLWILLLYLAAQVSISLWIARRIRSETDFFIAGRKLGTPLVAISMYASWFGAETCLGSSGAIYSEGLSGGRADPFGYTLCLLLMGVLLVRRLWQRKLLTLGDLFRQRFGPRVERLVVLLLVPSSLIWAAAQVRALGQVVSATMHLDVMLALYLSAIFVIAYTLLGGLLGDVITDVIQGLIMSLGLGLLLFFAFDSLGGASAALQRIEPERLRLFPAEEGVLQQLDRFSIPILGSLVAQELIARVLASRDMNVAIRGSFFASGLYFAVALSPVLLGLLGPLLLPNLNDPEQLLPELAARLLPGALYAVFSCALLSAILSTIDSTLLASSALLAHNLVVPALRVTGERNKLIWGRVLVGVSGVVAFVIALHADSIYRLVETASAFGTAGVLVTTLAALYWAKGGAAAASAALIVGLVTNPFAEYVLDFPAPFLASVAASAVVYAALAWTLPPRPIRVIANGSKNL